MYCKKCGCELTDAAVFCPGCGSTTESLSPVPVYVSPYAPPPGTSGYAGFWIRFVAYLLDSFLISILGLILLLPLLALAGISDLQSIDERVWLQGTMFFLWAGFILLFGAGGWLYATLLECSPWQATPGKKVIGLAVTDMDGLRISFGRANARFWAKILSGIMYIGFITIAFSDRKQGLHDMIAGTLVVRR